MNEEQIDSPANSTNEVQIDNASEQSILDNVDSNSNLETENQEKDANSISEEVNATDEENFGKFKNAKSLYSAYNSLQAEFTKKCQKLSELEKDNCDNSSLVEEITGSQELPQYDRADWTKKLGDFLSNNAEAKNYSTEISKVLLTNPSLAKTEDGLDRAWAKVLIDNEKTKQNNMKDESYINTLVDNNPQIKERIIADYIRQISSKKSPSLINSRVGSGYTVTGSKPVATLEEATRIVKGMFR